MAPRCGHAIPIDKKSEFNKQVVFLASLINVVIMTGL